MPDTQPTTTAAAEAPRFTPGPWAVLSGPMVVACGQPTEPGKGKWPPPSICSFRDARGEPFMGAAAEANARLIAQAPAMFQILQWLVEGWDEGDCDLQSLARDARKIIAAATGEGR